MRLGSPPRHQAETPRRNAARKVATVGVAAAALLWATATLASASVSTDAYYYYAGDTVQIMGDQMSPGENVTVDVDLPDGSLSQEHVVVADGNGAFADTYTLALDAPDGIYTVDATGQSSGSVFTTTFDPADAAACLAGTSTTGTGATQTSITVNWSSACSPVVVFEVDYGTASGSYGSHVGSAANTTSTTLTGLSCGTTYYFAVVASHDSHSSTSDEGSASTLACSTTPTADAGGPYTGVEGSPIALDGSSSTGTALTYAWSVTDLSSASNDTPGNSGGPACTFDDATSATPDLTCNDDSDSGSFQVTLTVTDGSSQTDTATANVTVSNVAPVVADSSHWTVTPSNCSVSVSAGFRDAGLNDTHTASIDWGDSTPATAGTVTEETASDGTGDGNASGSHVYALPGTYNIKVTVTDDDGDSGNATLSGFNNNPQLTYPIPPIMTGKTFNTGSTIPVKVVVTGCTSGLNPTIAVTPLNGTIKSSGKSNLLDQLRYTSALPGFIYNWNTKGWAVGTYVVTVNGLPGSVVISSNVQLTK